MLDFVLEGERRNASTTYLKAISITLLLIKLSGVRTSDASLLINSHFPSVCKGNGYFGHILKSTQICKTKC